MFEAEKLGLATPLDTKRHAFPASLLSDWITHSSFWNCSHREPGHVPYAQMGRQLADLHRTTTDHFGWSRDNYITTSQPNSPSSSWIF